MAAVARNLLLFFGLLALAGCAKTGDPQPPRILLPRPSVDLAAAQYDTRIRLTVSMPVENTDGSAVTTLREVEIFRIVENPGEDFMGLPEEELLARAERITAVGSDELRYHLHGGRLVFWDGLSSAASGDRFSQKRIYTLRFVNTRNQTAGFGNRVLIAPVSSPQPPGSIRFRYSPGRVVLEWDPPAENIDGSPAKVAAYNIYRSEDPEKIPAEPLNKKPLTAPIYQDDAFSVDRTYYYAVSTIGSLENPYVESSLSRPVAVDTRDTFAPSAPPSLTAVVEKGEVVLLWSPSPEADVAGYRVSRKDEGAAAFRPLHSGLLTEFSFRDGEVKSGQVYQYSVTAVDAHGNESKAAVFQVKVEDP